MFVCGLYLRNEIVYIPTMAKIPSGGYQEIDPVSVVPVSDADALKKALKENMAQGNPVIENYSPSDYSNAAVLKHAGVKSFSTFARGAQPWTIVVDGGAFEIQGERKRPDRGWERDPNNTIVFQSGATEDEVIHRMVQILQRTASASHS